jgi:uncharacterized protein (TIGR02300 family)
MTMDLARKPTLKTGLRGQVVMAVVGPLFERFTTMVDARLGVKRRCLSCNAPFYDLNRSPILCVKCGAPFQEVEYARSPPRRSQFRMGPVPSRAVEESAFPAGEEAGEESTIPPREDEDGDAESTRDLLGIDGEDKTPKN